MCDGQEDCPPGEEEDDCFRLICVGLLLCIGDNICVAQHEVCDDGKHCALSGDDEQLCGLPACHETCQCFGLAMLCVGRNYTNFPVYDRRTMSLDLSLNKLSNIPSFSKDYPNLLLLNLSSNSIGTVLSNQFTDQIYLLQLYLQNNNISDILPMSFIGLQNLHIISLIHNRISAIHSNTFYGLSSITHLDLSHGVIQYLRPLSFHGLGAVKHLNLAGNVITIIPINVFKGLDNFIVLDLSGNRLQNVALDAFQPLLTLQVVYPGDTGLCCFFVPSLGQDMKYCGLYQCIELCIGVIFRSVTYAFVALVVVSNGLWVAMEIIAILRTPNRWLRVPFINLSFSNMLIAIYWCIILTSAHIYGVAFQFYKHIWSGSLTCTIAGFFSVVSILGSTTSAMIIIIHWFVLVYTPFKAAVVCKRLWILFGACLLIPEIYLEISITSTVKHQNPMCFTVAPRMLTTHTMLLSILISSLAIFKCFIMIIFSTLTVVVAEKSRVLAGRKRSYSDISMMARLICLCIINSVKIAFLILIFLINLSDIAPEPGALKWVLLSLLNLNASVDPFLFALYKLFPTITHRFSGQA